MKQNYLTVIQLVRNALTLSNATFHYQVHHSMPLDPILSHMESTHSYQVKEDEIGTACGTHGREMHVGFW
jgi:hypothetical protein